MMTKTTTDAALDNALTSYHWYEALAYASDHDGRVVSPEAWEALARRLQDVNVVRARDCMGRANVVRQAAWAWCTLQAAGAACVSDDAYASGRQVGHAALAAARSLDHVWAACATVRGLTEWPAVWSGIVDGWYCN